MATAQAQADIDIDVKVNNNSGGDFTVVPEGIYLVEFVGFEDGPAFPNRQDPTKFDQTIRLKYQILQGDYTDTVIDELATLKGGIKSKLRQRAEVLQGRPYGDDEFIRLVPLYGRQAQAAVRVEERENGPRNKIESMVALPAPRAATEAPAPARPVTGRKF